MNTGTQLNSFAFVDESGVLDESSVAQPFFAVGLLKITDTARITEQLIMGHYDYFSGKRSERKRMVADLQENPKILDAMELNLLLASTRHIEYKFVNITPTTLERYKKFLDLAMQHSFHFCALVINKTDPLFNSTIYKNYWHAYIKYTKLLCERNHGPEERLCVIADYMNRPKDSTVFFENELAGLSCVFNALRAHSETFMLVQLVDVLLGSVVFQWKQQFGHVAKSSNRASAKAAFVSHLLSKLEIPTNKTSDYPLAQAITCNRPFYFSVWPLKPSQT